MPRVRNPVLEICFPCHAAERATDGRGKVFYTSLGYPDDFNEPAFRQLLVIAIDRALGR